MDKIYIVSTWYTSDPRADLVPIAYFSTRELAERFVDDQLGLNSDYVISARALFTEETFNQSPIDTKEIKTANDLNRQLSGYRKQTPIIFNDEDDKFTINLCYDNINDKLILTKHTKL